MREHPLIAQIVASLQQKRHLCARPPLVDVGDDAAVGQPFRRGSWTLTTDMVVEDVDFRWRWASPADVGSKAAAVNLSDLAAMGARPEALLIAIAAPSGPKTAARVRAMVAAADHVGRRLGAPVVGGDLSKVAGPWTIAVTALGHQVAAPMQRGRARHGDIVAVTRPLGAAAAGLRLLEAPRRSFDLSEAQRRRLVRAQLRPRADSRLGEALAEARLIHSAADLSDGLLRDARWLLAPQQGLILVPQSLPIASGVAQVAVGRGHHRGCVEVAPALCTCVLSLAVCGGEDFGLVLAIGPRYFKKAMGLAEALGHKLFAVGRVDAGPGVRWWQAPGMRLPDAFDHFCATNA